MSNCTECKFFLAATGPVPGPSVCRRFPPLMGLDTAKEVWRSSFPVIGAPLQIWCGEFQKKLILVPGEAKPTA